MSAESLWTGALTSDGVTVVARMARSSTRVRLAVTGPGGTVRSPEVATVGNYARIPITGLSANTEYTYGVELGRRAAQGLAGRFRTAPAGAGDYLIALAGDASELSNHVVFDAIRAKDPLLFVHLGDMHYNNLDTNNVANYRAVYDEVFAQSRQARLYREVPTAYRWDDHDFGVNNSDTNSVSKVAACAGYRERVPHYPLGDVTVTAPIYQSFTLGRVVYVMTDERCAATPNASTDNASKSMLGTTQKTWWKGIISSNPGKVIVWCASRAFGGVATAGADHWGGFTTERKELADHIKANAHGRVLVFSADAHALAIDAGSNHDFATGGGEPLPTFQAAPLDRTPDSVIYGAATYSKGWFNSNGQFGTMAITDSGGASVGVLWKGYDSSGSQLVQHSFSVNL